jgi:hypothetical protein
MSTTPSPTQLFLADALSTEPLSEEAHYIHPADLENGEFTSGQLSPGKRIGDPRSENHARGTPGLGAVWLGARDPA